MQCYLTHPQCASVRARARDEGRGETQRRTGSDGKWTSPRGARAGTPVVALEAIAGCLRLEQLIAEWIARPALRSGAPPPT